MSKKVQFQAFLSKKLPAHSLIWSDGSFTVASR